MIAPLHSLIEVIMKTPESQHVSISLPMIFLSLLLTLLLACGPQADKSTMDQMTDSETMEGVWELSGHYYVKDGDTLYAEPSEMGSENEIVSQVAFEEGRFKQETNSLLRGTIYLSVEIWKKLDQE